MGKQLDGGLACPNSLIKSLLCPIRYGTATRNKQQAMKNVFGMCCSSPSWCAGWCKRRSHNRLFLVASANQWTNPLGRSIKLGSSSACSLTIGGWGGCCFGLFFSLHCTISLQGKMSRIIYSSFTATCRNVFFTFALALANGSMFESICFALFEMDDTVQMHYLWDSDMELALRKPSRNWGVWHFNGNYELKGWFNFWMGDYFLI